MKISPSLLSADFGNLNNDVVMLNESMADMIHLDIMDGVFVPNISFGFPVIKYVQKIATKPLDVHLMIVNPQNYISQVRDCGAEIMNVHQEACNPSTPVSTLEDIISELDMVLLMSVNPGFGGQSFIPNSLKKVKQLKELITNSNSHALIEVDGGVNLETGKLLAEAGADILVAGNAVFSAPNPKGMIEALHNL